MSDYSEVDEVMASVHRISALLRQIEQEATVMGRAARRAGLEFQWTAVAGWRVEAELSFAEALTSVGIVQERVSDWGEYRATVAKAVAALQGADAGARYLARWDQIEARSLAVAEGGLR